jgi:hypothetical protein
MRLSSEASRILQALEQGAALKAHRTLDGAKVHKMHPLQGVAYAVPTAAVRGLEKQGWVRSNMKFPVATYLLTVEGKKAILQE